MKNLLVFLFTLLTCLPLYGQTALELYNNKDYQALIKLEVEIDKLSADELYMVGFAFFQLEKDQKAIEFYDKAIAKGLDNSDVHFYKGISLRYLEKFEEALKEIEFSLKKDPTNQEYMNEKGMVYYVQTQYDKALEIFEQAKNLPKTFPEPYYWIAVIYQEKKDFSKALIAYYDAIKNLPIENGYYLTSLISIGQIEYVFTKNYKKSSKAYSEAITLDNKNYDLYNKLLKSFNGEKEYTKADSLFKILKKAFDNGKLSKEFMETKTIGIAQFEWNGQMAAITQSFITPENILDISHQVFLLNKTGDKIERNFQIEKTIQLDKDGAKYLLCEQNKQAGEHITYPYGWATDNIPLDDLQKAITLVLDGKMKKSASSNYGRK